MMYRLALRTLLRNKSSYLGAAGILAVGLGMSVAMFSLVNAVLLRPLPFPGQAAIHLIWKTDPLRGQHIEELAYPELGDLKGIQDFEYAAVMPTSVYGYAKVLQTGEGDPVQLESAPVSHDFFRVLGITPLLGRGFTDSDEHVGAPPVAVISDAVWRDRLGANPRIVGQLIRLNGQGVTVIGVLARGAEFPRGAQLWVPLGIDQAVVSRRGATFLQAIVRTKPGVPRARIASEVNALFERLAAEHPEVYTLSQRGVVTPLVEYWTGSARMHLWIMLAASLLLFVAATISAGSLLLSRMLARRAEIATRLALGARPGQILAQLGAEGALVAMIAVGAGLGVAQAAIRGLVTWAPADIPRLGDAALNFDSFCFAAAAALLAAVGCTVIPGWSAMGMHLEAALREGSVRSSLSRRGGAGRNLFLLAQAAVTMTLLATACLLVLSYRGMMSADIGFANRDALSINLQLRGPAVNTASRRIFYSALLSQLRAAPGVTSAAAILLRPLEGTIGWDVPYEFGFEADARESSVLPKANYEVVTPGYFQTVGTAMVEGRDFDDRDSETGEPVVIISQQLARKIRAAGDVPVGSRVRLGLGKRGWSKVVGICADARYRNITQTGADVFVPWLQAAAPTNYLVIRGTLGTRELAALVRHALTETDPGQTIAGLATIGDLIDANSARHRFNMILLTWFGVFATLLAASGVYSVIRETMAARRREIAIRNALGAPRNRLVRLLVSRTLGFVALGETLGALLMYTLGTLASGLLYGVSARDPALLGLVAGILFLVASAAAFWPAWRAAGGDPRLALSGD